MYILAVILTASIFVPFIVHVEGVDDNSRLLWAIIAAILAGLSFGLGYSQKPKTEAQACET
jgi:hypothetical protein